MSCAIGGLSGRTCTTHGLPLYPDDFCAEGHAERCVHDFRRGACPFACGEPGGHEWLPAETCDACNGSGVQYERRIGAHGEWGDYSYPCRCTGKPRDLLHAIGHSGQRLRVEGAIALLRKAFRNDGAEGESVHQLCDALDPARRFR